MASRRDSTPVARTVVQHTPKTGGGPVAVYVIPTTLPDHDFLVAARKRELAQAGLVGIQTITVTHA